LTFENSIDESYVTEKYFDSLHTGVVPIYFGAPNIHLFDPGYGTNLSSALINVAAFPKVADLANEILRVGTDEKEYNKFLEWKRYPPTEQFKYVTSCKASAAESCRLCSEVKRIRLEKQQRQQARKQQETRERLNSVHHGRKKANNS